MTEKELLDRGSQEPDWEEISGELWLQREKLVREINRDWPRPGRTLEAAYQAAMHRFRDRFRRQDTERYANHLGNMDIEQGRVRRKW